MTGGAGFFGFRLGKALAMQGISVILLDLHQPRWELPDGAVFLQVRKVIIRLLKSKIWEKIVIQQNRRNTKHDLVTPIYKIVYMFQFLNAWASVILKYYIIDRHALIWLSSYLID